MNLRDRWENIRVSDISFAPVGVYDRILLPCYSEPHRFYHNLSHLEHAFRVFDEFLPRELFPMADVLSLALFFHDVRYQPEMSDNEEKSVALFRSLVPTSPEVQDRVASMILDTRTHDTSDPASQFLLDVDLSILGAPEADYQEYCRNIRREYDFVPDDTYRNGRIHVLTRFLEKSRIFFYIPHLEVPARRNIQTEIEALRRGQP